VHPRGRSHWKPGVTALVLNQPVPLWFPDGDIAFVARMAIRKGRAYVHRATTRKNRLVSRKIRTTLYSVERYEYTIFRWGAASNAPEVVSIHADKTSAAKQLGAMANEQE